MSAAGGRRRRAARGSGRLVRRIAAAAAAGVVVVAGLAAFTCWLTLPSSHQTLKIAGLAAPVAITFDSLGVPRIKAASEADAAIALGYVHARDRLFQMELMRRAASGRLAELAGAAALPLDRMARTLGEMQHAEHAYADLPEETRALLIDYTLGVNAWIAERGRLAAPEFLVLGAPAPWRPVDCMLWSETVALWLSDNFRTELSNLALRGKLAPDKIRQLWPPQPYRPAPDAGAALQQGFWGGAPDALPSFPEKFTLPGEASNAWAVDAHHTATGAPLLAGDPHLALQFPGIWYLARIETPANVLVGATAPGVPFLIIGRNAHVAWTFTSTEIDTQDLFVETPLPGGMYATPAGPQPFMVRQERIHVRGGADEVLTVRSTRHGPVISDLLGPKNGPVLALEAAQFQLESAAPGILALDRAKNLADVHDAAAKILAPVQNLTAADAHGIALFTSGAVPVRGGPCANTTEAPTPDTPVPASCAPDNDSTLPVSGADGVHDWKGFASADALPHFMAPASGIVVNANERTAPPDFPVFLGKDFAAPWRARRIHALLDARPTESVADFAAMQGDVVSVFAGDLLPAFRALPVQPGATGRAQALLAHWDGTMADALPQPLIFNAAVQRFVSVVLAANHVPERDAGPWASFAAWLLTPAGGGWCAGDCRPVLARALHDVVGELAEKYGDDPASWRWGDAHQAVFIHPILGDLPLIGAFASRHVAVPGDDTTLFVGGSGRLGDFTARHGPGYRGVYDLADPEHSRFVATPGQSGNIFSPHAWDMLPLWAAGTTIVLPPSPDRVSATIALKP